MQKKKRSKFAIATWLVILTLAALGISRWFPRPQEPGYRFVKAWGKSGTQPGQFEDPIGIVVAEDQIFVSDSGNHRIQVFDRQGKFLRSFGSQGENLGELSRPMSMGIHKDILYVAEYTNDRIQKFSLANGESQGVLGSSGSGAGEFDLPADVAVDDDGKIYVADFTNNRVQVLDASGKFLDQFGKTGSSGIGAGSFNYPTGVGFLPDGNLLVADTYNDRVQVFEPGGKFVRKWGGPFATNIPGSFNGWFKNAAAVTADQKGQVFVADFYNHRIQKFTAKGKFLAVFGKSGSQPGQFKHPTDMAVDADGNVYVVDFGNDRIQKFAPGAKK